MTTAAPARAASTRLQAVDVGERSLASYFNVAPVHILEALDREAERLRGARILHLNATPYGGGVSELLRSGVPLLADLGLDVEWHVISGNEPFFRVTKPRGRRARQRDHPPGSCVRAWCSIRSPRRRRSSGTASGTGSAPTTAGDDF